MERDFLGEESLLRLLELIKTELSKYVKSEEGKGLSTEDFTTELHKQVTSIKNKVDKNTASWSRDIVYGQGKRNGAETVMMVGEDPTASGVIPRFIKSTKDGKTSIVLRTNEPVNDTDCTNKKYVDDIVGDVETALDAILAIQKELLGDKEEITFTLHHGYTDTTDTLTAQKGMTWGEWCESEYNTIGAYIIEGAIDKIVMHNVAGGEHYIHYEYGTPDFIEAQANDTIEEGHEYVCPNWGV